MKSPVVDNDPRQPRKRLLTEADLDHWFARRDAVHAKELVRSAKVLQVEEVRPGWLASRVLADSTVEEQTIGLCVRAGQVFIEAACTCEQGEYCVHAAAALLAEIAHPGLEVRTLESGAGIAPTSPRLERWLHSVSGSVGEQQILYVLKPGEGPHSLAMEFLVAKRAKNGEWAKPAAFRSQVVGLAGIDAELVEAAPKNLKASKAGFRLEGSLGAHLLFQALATGRCYWGGVGGPALSVGPDVEASLAWESGDGAVQEVVAPGFDLPIFAMAPPVYVDAAGGVVGRVELGLSAEVAEVLLAAPAVLPEHAERAREILKAALPDHPAYWPSLPDTPEVQAIRPTPVLTLGVGVLKQRDAWVRAAKGIPVRWARLEFEYAGHRVAEGSGPVRSSRPGGSVLIPRMLEAENNARQRLLLDFVSHEEARGLIFEGVPAEAYLLLPANGSLKDTDLEQEFFRFLGEIAPAMEADGWRIDAGSAVRPRIVRTEKLEGAVTQSNNDWFDFKLGVRIEDQLVDLRAVLPSVFERILRTDGGSEDIYLRSESGALVAVPISRLKPIVQGLVELFGRPEKWSKQLKLPASRAGEAALLGGLAEKHSGFSLKADERFMQLASRLQAWKGIVPLSPPKGFVGELRAYQKEGSGWLGFLGEFGLGGILADDMGLGKTIQTLAHVVAEKEQGRLHHPVLVVAPTSTLPNWEAEIARFSPGLTCLKLHGPDRAGDFTKIPRFDLVLTSYPLLARDVEPITRHEFHMAVLDEAQNIKNHTTKMAKAALEIKAGHRVALSGTPIENNLQELWSLFRFALPDLLGTAQEFKADFRQPIEFEGNKAAQELLSRRIRPFILRRTKGQVASELPPKTIIWDRVELDELQRDLYESVRLAMDEKVRKLFSGKGFERSRVEVLDALLKLRQVCCDPRLVKLPSAAGVTASAKLDRLTDILAELSGEGRKALVFSQFTSMLELIEPRLKELGIKYVKLTGQTKDRAQPVKDFQEGDAPVFLISLKAGGTGLNLTAADTVIHYDPWWNPAVENQATDRAHRIGQDKPVFVYKLVAVNTIEEKILELQEKKAHLAEMLLAGTAEAASSLSADDLRWLIA